MRNTNERGDRHFMNSNEEYLDSLLKAVTNGQGLETDIDGANKQTESDLENEFILDAPEWDEEDTSTEIMDAISDLDSLITESDAGENLSDNTDISEEEKAFSDPGALFFEGEEETEDDLFLNDMAEGSQPIGENALDQTDVEDLLFPMRILKTEIRKQKNR